MAFRPGYFISESLASLRRNLLLTLAAILTVAVSLCILGMVMVWGEIVNKTVRGWESLIEVQVFLRDDITPEQSKELQSLVAGMPEVKKVDYISKENAFEEYKEMFAESPAVYEHVEPEALPASYRVSLKTPKTAQAVTTRLEGQPGVDEVTFGGEDVKRLLRITTLARRGFFVVIAVLLAAAVLLIANTIRLAIYARRKEIAIMKLVGATNWFVRVPFIFEGMFEGVLGALLASGIIFGGKMLLLDKWQQEIVFLPLTVGLDVVFRIFLILFGIGLMVGAVGSGVALRRFLEV
jgi:cell division transport system permease protein